MFVTDFISRRPKDPELSCSCTLRTRNRYRTSLSGKEVQAEPDRLCAVWGSECIMFLPVGSVSLLFLLPVKLFRSPEKTYKVNALCNFCCFTDCLGLSLKIKEIGRTRSESAVPCVTGFEDWPVVISTVL